MRNPSALSFALASMILFAGCSELVSPRTTEGVEFQAPAQTKRLVTSVNSEPIGLVQLLTVNRRVAGSIELYRLMNAGLTYPDDQDILHPLLAEAVPTLDNGLWKLFPDGRMETSWRLKPGILWHDGVTLTPEDLVFSFQVYRDQGLEILRPGALRFVDSVEVTDPRTVVVRWREHYIEADTMFTPYVIMPMARHLLEETYVHDKPSFFNHRYWWDEFVGTGPYRLVGWVPGSHLLLKANDQYLLGRPKIDEIEVKFIPDFNTLIANLLAGTVESLIATEIPADRALSLRDRAPNLNVVRGQLATAFPLYTQFLNTDPPIVLNLDFRRALLQAIDRREMTDAANYGIEVPIAHTWLQPDTAEYPVVEKQIVRYEYDPRRATQVIEGLGYARGPDGVLRDSSGQRLHIEIRTTATNPFQGPATLSVADYWKRLGIDVEINTIPAQLMEDREYLVFPAFMLVGGGQSVKSQDMLSWVSSESPLPGNAFQGRNRTRYQNPEFDALIQWYVSTIPKPERLAALGEILHHQTDQLTILPLFYRASSTVPSSKRLKNATSIKVMENAHLWDLE